VIDPSNIGRWYMAVSEDGPDARNTTVILLKHQHLPDCESVPGLRHWVARYCRGADATAILQFSVDPHRACDEDLAPVNA
jgi:hypothetical protein